MMSFPRNRSYELRITNLLSRANTHLSLAGGLEACAKSAYAAASADKGVAKALCACVKMIAFCIFFFSACDTPYPPKPKGYYRIDLPEKSYREFSSESCPFKFQYPVYAEIIRDSLFFDKAAENPCWLNIDFKELGGKIHLSYKEINEKNSLEKLIEDAHKLTFKHTLKADFIDENAIQNEHGVSGILFEVGGNAASNAQFFLTDSTKHFLRGSLYFSSTPNEDSLAPVIRFVKEDMLILIQSFEWAD